MWTRHPVLTEMTVLPCSNVGDGQVWNKSVNYREQSSDGNHNKMSSGMSSDQHISHSPHISEISV